jgi:hypothetical protein
MRGRVVIYDLLEPEENGSLLDKDYRQTHSNEARNLRKSSDFKGIDSKEPSAGSRSLQGYHRLLLAWVSRGVVTSLRLSSRSFSYIFLVPTRFHHGMYRTQSWTDGRII